MVAHQTTQPPVAVYISATDRIGEEFVPRHGNTAAVYYPGEEMKFKVRLVNHADKAEAVVNLPETVITEHIAFRWIEMPDRKVEPLLVFKPGHVYQGESLQPEAQVENTTTLKPKETISTLWELAAKDDLTLAPGHYEVEVTYDVPLKIQRLQRSGQAITVHTTRFRFEFRQPTTLEDKLEIMYRSAVRDYFRKDYDQAISKIKQLLALYPSSSVAYSHLGRISFERGEYAQTIGYDQKAIDLLQTGADVIRLHFWAVGHNKNHIIAFLQGRIQAAKERLQRR
jgi:tetratricopeptide (TPR) repeat protein